jgi:hypothetical protein
MQAGVGRLSSEIAYRGDSSYKRKHGDPPYKGDQSSVELANYNIAKFDIRPSATEHSILGA